MRLHLDQGGPSEQRCYPRRLVPADLNRQQAAGFQARRRAVQNPPIGRQPVPPAVQCQGGVVPADFRVQRLDLSAWDVGRIGNDKMEPALQSIAEVALPQAAAVV